MQHWWLPHSGQGVRTHISDDRVWLSFVTAHYVALTGDRAILDVQVPFIEGPPLPRERHDAFFAARRSASSTATLFEHCRRGLDGALHSGQHGLPLIGTGDWNDGMNRVGEHGRGESVWLGWFLHATLHAFAPARAGARRARARHRVARPCHQAARRARAARLGWRVVSPRLLRRRHAARLARTTTSADRRHRAVLGRDLRRRESRARRARHGGARRAAAATAIRRWRCCSRRRSRSRAQEPGYVKAYPRGIRENGGQYTHAAVWTVDRASRCRAMRERAMEVFNMLNPIRRTATRADVQRYKVEPYVVAADVYSEAPHAGRGGWTWYTGSAGWLYRAGLEWILGFRVRENRLTLAPCVPAEWPGFTIHYRHHGAHHVTPYEIIVDKQPDAARAAAAGRRRRSAERRDATPSTCSTMARSHTVHMMWRAATAARGFRCHTE